MGRPILNMGSFIPWAGVLDYGKFYSVGRDPGQWAVSFCGLGSWTMDSFIPWDWGPGPNEKETLR